MLAQATHGAFAGSTSVEFVGAGKLSPHDSLAGAAGDDDELDELDEVDGLVGFVGVAAATAAGPAAAVAY